MRKLKLQVQMSIDGFIAGPNGEMDWLVFDWDEQLKEYVTQLTDPVDCILLGRKLAEGFIPHWAAQPAGEDPAGVAKMNDTAKVVFTKTLTESPWANSSLAHGDLAEEINALKGAAGSDIIAYGGATFVSGLIANNLIDELNLFINPVAIGSGMSIFKNLSVKQGYVLQSSTVFPCGIVALQYGKLS